MDLKNEVNFKFGGVFANTYSSYLNKNRAENSSPSEAGIILTPHSLYFTKHSPPRVYVSIERQQFPLCFQKEKAFGSFQLLSTPSPAKRGRGLPGLGREVRVLGSEAAWPQAACLLGCSVTQ